MCVMKVQFIKIALTVRKRPSGVYKLLPASWWSSYGLVLFETLIDSADQWMILKKDKKKDGLIWDDIVNLTSFRF